MQSLFFFIALLVSEVVAQGWECDVASSVGATQSISCNSDGACRTYAVLNTILMPGKRACLYSQGHKVSVAVPNATAMRMPALASQMQCRPYVRADDTYGCYGHLTEGILDRSAGRSTGKEKVCRSGSGGLTLCYGDQPYWDSPTYPQSCNNSGVWTYLRRCSNDCGGIVGRTHWYAWMCLQRDDLIVERMTFAPWQFAADVVADGEVAKGDVRVESAGFITNEFEGWTLVTNMSGGTPFIRSTPVVPFEQTDLCAMVMSPATGRYESIRPAGVLTGDCGAVVGSTKLSFTFHQYQMSEATYTLPVSSNTRSSTLLYDRVEANVAQPLSVKIYYEVNSSTSIYGYSTRCQLSSSRCEFTPLPCPSYGMIRCVTPCTPTAASDKCAMIFNSREGNWTSWMAYGDVGVTECQVCLSSGEDLVCHQLNTDFKRCIITPGKPIELRPVVGGETFQFNLGDGLSGAGGTLAKALGSAFGGIMGMLLIAALLFVVIKFCSCAVPNSIMSKGERIVININSNNVGMTQAGTNQE